MIPESPSIVNKHSTSLCGRLRSRTTTAPVWLLGWLLAWKPRLALALGKRSWLPLAWIKEA